MESNNRWARVGLPSAGVMCPRLIHVARTRLHFFPRAGNACNTDDPRRVHLSVGADTGAVSPGRLWWATPLSCMYFCAGTFIWEWNGPRGRTVTLCLTLWGTARLASRPAVLAHGPTGHIWGSHFSTSSPTPAILVGRRGVDCVSDLYSPKD